MISKNKQKGFSLLEIMVLFSFFFIITFIFTSMGF